MSTWGIVATIKAPVKDTLRFAAYHLSQGAHRLYLYLDDADEATFVALNDHPQITPILTDDLWWEKRGRRPEKHQVRQARNATHCYRRLARVEWLAHIDVDEFLVSTHSINDVLSDISAETVTARVRPMEQLSGEPTLFKAFVPSGAKRRRLTDEIYPTFGHHLKAGFLSHLAGKLFVRTGVDGIRLRIHQIETHSDDNPREIELTQVDLAHAHAKSWDQFRATFKFRLEKGSYRPELAPERSRKSGGLTLHELFHQIAEHDGDTGLRAFFDEVCAATPQLIRALEKHNLLRRVDLNLDTHLREHFPEYA